MRMQHSLVGNSFLNKGDTGLDRYLFCTASDEDIDAHVSKTINYRSWKEMLTEALEDYSGTA